MKLTPLKKLISGYERGEASLSDARTAHLLGRNFYAKKISGLSSLRRRHSFKNTRAYRAFDNFWRSIVYISCRSVGFYLLAFGLLTLLLHFSKYYSTDGADIFLPLMIGAVASLLSIPLLLSGRPLCLVLQQIPLTDTLFFEFFCLRRMHPAEAVDSLPGAVSALFGAGVALFGFFVSMPLALFLPPAILFFFLSLSAPEFPFFTTLILLPYMPMMFPHPSVALAALVLCGLLSFARKVVRGNRVFYLEQYDAVLLLFALTLLIGGAVAGMASLRVAAYLILLLFGYTFAGNLISNRRLVDGIFHALIYASVPISLFAIFQFVAGKESYFWFGREISGLVGGHVTGTFDVPDTFAVYLLAVIILTVSRALDRQRSRALRFSCAFLVLLQTAALVLTGAHAAWFALGFSLFAYAVLKAVRRHPGLLLTLLTLLPYVIFLLPREARTWCLSVLASGTEGAAETVARLKGALTMFRDRLFTGAGVGADAFRAALSGYLPDTIGADTVNLFLEIGCEAGLFALLFFVLLLFVRARHLSSYARYLTSASVGTHATAVTVALFALLVYGMTEDIFASPAMFYLFFVLFGIGSATLRLAKKDRDERLIYYGDDRSADASVADILISDNRN